MTWACFESSVMVGGGGGEGIMAPMVTFCCCSNDHEIWHRHEA